MRREAQGWSDDGFIDAAGHENWVPLSLDVPPERLKAELAERYVNAMSQEELETNVSAAVGIARTLTSGPPWEETGVATCAAWEWVRDPRVFVPTATAVLRAAVLDRGQSVDDCIRLVVGGTCTTDSKEGAELGPALEELAAGMRGI